MFTLSCSSARLLTLVWPCLVQLALLCPVYFSVSAGHYFLLGGFCSNSHRYVRYLRVFILPAAIGAFFFKALKSDIHRRLASLSRTRRRDKGPLVW